MRPGLRRTKMSPSDMISAPFAGRAKGALCLTCGRTCDKEELVEGYPGETTFARVRVRHHNVDEVRTFDMGSTNWDEQDLASFMRKANWFDPGSHDGLALGERGPSIDTIVENDDLGVEKKAISFGAAPVEDRRRGVIIPGRH